MSSTTISHTFKVNGIAVNVTTAKLSSSDSVYGVKRTDTSAVVVADNTAMVNTGTGVYSYTFTDPAFDLTYQYSIEIVYNGNTYYMVETIEGGLTSTESLYADAISAHILPYVNGKVSEAIWKQAIRQSAREFCEQTEVWREWLATIDSVVDQEDYTLVHSHNAVIRRVLEVEIDAIAMTADSFSDDCLTLTLLAAPADAGTDIDVKVVFIPKEANTTLPTWIINAWGYRIAKGALSFLQSQSKRPWTDQNGAIMNYRIFTDGIGMAREQRFSQRGGDSQRMPIRRFV